MDVVYWLIPAVLFVGFIVVLIFIWMAKSGQFDDLDGAANSIFMDDDEEDLKPRSSAQYQDSDSTESEESHQK